MTEARTNSRVMHYTRRRKSNIQSHVRYLAEAGSSESLITPHANPSKTNESNCKKYSVHNRSQHLQPNTRHIASPGCRNKMNQQNARYQSSQLKATHLDVNR